MQSDYFLALLPQDFFNGESCDLVAFGKGARLPSLLLAPDKRRTILIGMAAPWKRPQTGYPAASARRPANRGRARAAVIPGDRANSPQLKARQRGESATQRATRGGVSRPPTPSATARQANNRHQTRTCRAVAARRRRKIPPLGEGNRPALKNCY